jgi:integrase
LYRTGERGTTGALVYTPTYIFLYTHIYIKDVSLHLACGLRRGEVAALELDDIQRREHHWAIVDLTGKGGRVRTVPVPDWVTQTIAEWVAAAGINSGRLF